MKLLYVFLLDCLHFSKLLEIMRLEMFSFLSIFIYILFYFYCLPNVTGAGAPNVTAAGA